MINDHLDTYLAVEAERWTMCDGNPFQATRHGNWLYGRGTSDTRGNLAASLIAIQALVEASIQLKGDLLCCYTVDEEKDGTKGRMAFSINHFVFRSYDEIPGALPPCGQESGPESE